MRKMGKGNITYGILFKIFLFVVLAASVVVGLSSVWALGYLTRYGAYTNTYRGYRYEAFREAAMRHLDSVCMEEQYVSLEDIKKAYDRDSQWYGVGYDIRRSARTTSLWSNASTTDTSLIYTHTLTKLVNDGKVEFLAEYEFTIFVYEDFPKMDEFWVIDFISSRLYAIRGELLYLLGFSIVFFLTSFIWLMCNAGCRRGQEGVVPSVLTPLPLEVLAAVFGVVGFALCVYIDRLEWRLAEPVNELAVIVLVGVISVWCTFFLREMALRMKLGKWWEGSLIYRLVRWICHILYLVGKALLEMAPQIYHIVAAIILVKLCEFIALNSFRKPGIGICWIIESLITVPVFLYCALAFKKLQKGSQALAEGELTGKLDTKHLVWGYGRLAENLNQINDGISRAVEQKMRSERLKTELITNVSHDIRTPLTSVINYADLLGNEAGKADGGMDQEKVAEYSEVLVRQSKRLKKLLEDLLEASKATTGSLEVNLAPCELGVLLTQAAGEYEARFEEKGLDLRIRKPEEDVRIMADGKHLWRVFDNLLGNIYKYAQEGSRVFLDMEKQGECVQIMFRNMSKYELEVSAEELEERFVRGDKSRNMEGNGLGLSIAKSLVELQGGTMELVTDGDLFKVILRFLLS